MGYKKKKKKGRENKMIEYTWVIKRRKKKVLLQPIPSPVPP
jgi:hypothetical protein